MLGLAVSMVVATIALAVGNGGIAVWLTAGATLRHTLIPDELLGRVTAAWRTAAMGAIPVGMVAGGFVADAFGVRAPFLAGVPLVIGATLLARRLPHDEITTARNRAG